MPVKAPYEDVDMNQVVRDNLEYEHRLEKRVNIAGFTGVISGIMAGIIAVIMSIFLVLAYIIKG